MTLGELIYRYRMDHRLSQRAFANKCGVSNVYINMLEKNENPSTGKPIVPSAMLLKTIGEVMGYSLDEITRLLDPDTVIDTTPKTPQEAMKTIPGYSRAPYIPKPMPENDGTRQLSSADPKRKITPRRFDILGTPHNEKVEIDVDLTITVIDDSMYPTYLKNDILYIKSQDFIGFNGQVMAIMIDAKTTLVRHIYQDPRGEGLVLTSDNPAYKTEYKQYKDFPEMRLVGWICGFTRIYDFERRYKRD